MPWDIIAQFGQAGLLAVAVYLLAEIRSGLKALEYRVRYLEDHHELVSRSAR